MKDRVSILDGLRVIAIVMVMLYHYYFRFLDSHYTYSFNIPTIFKYGYLGVELFFIISGFVISLTLTKCTGFIEFIKKRFVRLIPAMVICSSKTFIFIILFDNNNLFAGSKSLVNLLISNSFISPLLINTLLPTNVSYIDGAYWSLWVEITFYIIAGLLYFFSPQKLILNFSIIVFIGIIGFFLFVSETGLRLLTPYIGEYFYTLLRIFLKYLLFLNMESGF
jgi:peptidoglycan/LPS O-acetylase OafA/YrhL